MPNMTFYLQSLYQEIVGASITFLPKFLVSTIFVFVLFYLLYIVAGAIFDRILSRNHTAQRSVVKFLRRVTRVALVLFGIITIFGTWGIDVNALVAGLGLTGFALGFALKDALASILAGILILIHKPFKIGDKIDCCNAVGEVIDIDMRYTTLNDNGNHHLIPNAKLFTEKVTILSGKKK